ncbi:MAG: extracellular solute-binding protein [Beijerinckiaceae bacterium]
MTPRITMEETMRYRISALALAVALAAAMPAAAQNAAVQKVVDKPITLTIHFHWDNKFAYRNDWPVEKEAARLTGVTLNSLTSTATTSTKDAFNLLMASGKLPDIVGGGGAQANFSMREQFNQYGMEGAFLPLNDLIAKHAPNIKAVFDKRPELRQAITAPDGNIYYIPYLPDGKFGRAYYVRQDWLDKLGLKQPQNVDELYEVLTAFRNRDPNGNGRKDEIPYFNREWPELIRLVTLWDARSSGSDTYHDFYVDNGQIRHPYAQENYRTGIRNLAKWYKEGLIDPEIFTRGPRSREALLGGDIGGMTHDWFASTASYNDALRDKVPGFNFIAMIPPASVGGKRIEEHRRIPVKPDGWAISHTNKDPVATIKYFDFWFTEAGRRLANFGVEGVHHDVVDGKAKYKPEILSSRTPVNSQMYDVGAQAPRGYPQDYEYERQWTNKAALEGIALYEKGDYLVPDFLGVALDKAQKATYDKHWSSILTYMLEQQQAWILGTRDVEKDWPAYTAQLDRLGFKLVMTAMQAAYDRQYKKK